MISIVLNKSISSLRDYKYSVQTPEALDECTCLTLLNPLINPVADLNRHIKIYERVENKGVGLTGQQVMDDVLEYLKVSVIIQSYAKDHYYAKAMGTTSDPKDTRRAWRHAAAAATS